MNIKENLNSYSWHDCPLYALKFDDNLVFDIDYILEWKLIGETNKYEYLLAPAFLEFEDVTDLKINIESDFINGLEIYKISFEDDKVIVRLQEGIIEFKAKSFIQKLLKEPIWKQSQYLSEEERKL